MVKARWKLVLALAGALALVAPATLGQSSYPGNPIRIVVGFAPGGGADLIARTLGQKLSSQMNTSVVVLNREGAGSNIAAEMVAKSAPDGYTLLLTTPAQVLSIAFGEKLGYDLLRDLAPVALLANQPPFLFVHPGVPANTPSEFIAYVKSNPDKLAYGSGGTGSITHLAPLLFLQVNGLSALHVPYKGSGPAILDLIAGRIQFTMQSSANTIVPMVKDKRIKALAIAGLRRSPVLPDVPTLAETAMPGFEIGSWYGVTVPAKTPSSIIQRLNSEIDRALREPDMIALLAQEPIKSTPEEFGNYMKRDLERWTKVIKSAGIKLE